MVDSMISTADMFASDFACTGVEINPSQFKGKANVLSEVFVVS